MPAIINSGVSYITSQQAATQPVAISEFVLANITGLDHSQPVNLAEVMPAAEDIVWQGTVTRAGYINPNAVVYSLMLGSNVGDFDFNWIGLRSGTGELIAVNYVPVIEKRKTFGTTQGNNITRNFMIEFSDAQDATGLTVDANTWQIDFTHRLKLIDEHERESNADIYGEQAFFFDGWKITFDGSKHYATAGVGYVAGIRLVLPADIEITPGAVPTDIWLDVSYQGDINGVDADAQFVFSSTAQSNYTDVSGQDHYLVKIASLAADGAPTDERQIYDVTSSVMELVDRAATEAKAGRAKIATSAEATEGTDHTKIITPKTLAERLGNYLGKTAKAASALIADKWTTARKITLSGDATGNVTIDGSQDVTLSVAVEDDSHNHTTSNIDNFAEAVADTVGAMVGGNSETNIAVTYQDGDNTLDFSVPNASTGVRGAVQLSTSVSSTSTSLAATASAVKSAYDKGNHSHPYIGTSATLFVLEDGDGTERTIVGTGKEIKFREGGNVDINWTDTSTGSDGDPYDLTFTVPNASTSGRGAVQLSTSVSSTSTSLAATSSAVRAAYNLAAGKAGANIASKSSNGYWKCGSTGLIIQWGWMSVGGNTTRTVSYPIAFPSYCRSFTTSDLYKSNDTGGVQYNCTVRSVGRTSTSVSTYSSHTGFYWMAVGY